MTLVVDPHKTLFHLDVSAEGYPKGHGWGANCRTRLVPSPWYSWPEEYQVEIYRDPQPTAEVTFPNGYRGIVLVRVPADSTLPEVPGQRKFSYTASPRGLVTLKESALFETAADRYDCIHARYPDGTIFPTLVPDRHMPEPVDGSGPKFDEIALRFVTREWVTTGLKGDAWLYVLGTAAEAEAVKRSVWPDDNHFDEAAFKRIVESR